MRADSSPLRVVLCMAASLALLAPASCTSGPDGRSPHEATSVDRTPNGEPEPLNVGFLIVDGVYNTELTAPYDIFHHTVFHTRPGMRVFTVAPDRSPVRTFEGLRIVPDHGFDDAPPIDVLVVPSAEHSMGSDLEDERMLAWVRQTGSEADFVLSLCDGAFVLAAAGLLDGRAATTFPADVASLRGRFPEVDVREDLSFVHDGKAITSAGGALSFDPALYLCELLWGEAVARNVARGLVIDWRLEELRYLARPSTER